jgi:TfoX/Sxy family transcriptional regulator of competence genes
MYIPKPSAQAKAVFRELTAQLPGAQAKPMFGNLGAFVNGNMFMGLFGEDLGLKLDEPARAELVALGGGAFGPPERPMSGYTTVPWAWMEQRVAAAAWVERAHAYVASLPAKVPKPRKSPGPRQTHHPH